MADSAVDNSRRPLSNVICKAAFSRVTYSDIATLHQTAELVDSFGYDTRKVRSHTAFERRVDRALQPPREKSRDLVSRRAL